MQPFKPDAGPVVWRYIPHGSPCDECCPHCRSIDRAVREFVKVPETRGRMRCLNSWHDRPGKLPSLIAQEFMACPDYAPFETCPCCEGRPT